MIIEKHIILIDDDPIIHMSFEMMLFGSKYRKTSITNPAEAIRYQQFKDKYDKPDLMLIDYMMGQITGIDVIKSIRADSDFEWIPIILFTGYHEKMVQEVGLLKELNIACVLPKPLTKEQLLRELEAYINI
jgi:CheY-like chemotaxis protein